MSVTLAWHAIRNWRDVVLVRSFHSSERFQLTADTTYTAAALSSRSRPYICQVRSNRRVHLGGRRIEHCFIAVLPFVPETKVLSLEELDQDEH